MRLYQRLSSLVAARLNCINCQNLEWLERHEESIEKLVKNYMPYGSGFDSGTKLDFEKSNPEKLVFRSAFHHMDDVGYYTGWSHFIVIVTPSLQFGFNFKIKGEGKVCKAFYLDRDYFVDVFAECLEKEV